MNKFYVVYRLGDSFPGAESKRNAYEIYDSERDFLTTLRNYIVEVKNLKLSDYEDYFEDLPEELEEYKDFMELIEQGIENGAALRNLYKNGFYCLDTEIDIIAATADYRPFLNALCQDLLDRNDMTEMSDVWELDPDDRRELFQDNELLRYFAMIQASGKKAQLKTFIAKFKENEYEINDGAFMIYL